MAESTKYGPWVATDDWRSWVGVSISASTATTATVTVRGWFESQYGSSTGSGNVKGWVGFLAGSSDEDDIKWSGASNIDPFSTGAGFYFNSGTNWTVNKTHSAQTVWGYADVEGVAGLYNGSKSQCYAAVTVPAKTHYTVSFNANGGSGAPSAQTKWYGESLTLSSTAPTRSGYTFLGWGTSASATSATYQPEGSYTANSGATLYAVWRKSLTLTYDGNGSTSVPSAQTAYLYNAQKSASVTLRDGKPTRSGWTFVGWSTSSTATSASYQPKGSVSISANTKLYAIWSKTLTLSYDANGGSGAPSVQNATIYNATTSKSFKLSATMPTRANYDFKGWAKASDATSAAYQPNGSVSISANTKLYAVWGLRYVAPTLTVTAFRSDAQGSASATSTSYLTVETKWSLSQSDGENTSATLVVSIDGTSKATRTLSGTSGTETTVISGTFPQGDQVQVSVAVTDVRGMVTTVQAVVAPAFYPMTFANGGHSAAFFGMASPTGSDVLNVNGELLVSGGQVSITGDASWIYLGSEGSPQWRLSKGNQGLIQYYNGTAWVNI